MAASQRRFVRHGLPGAAADAGTCGPDRVTAGDATNATTRSSTVLVPRRCCWTKHRLKELKDLGPIEFEQVRRTADEPLFNSLMEHHHYLGYEQPVGEHLKYVCWAQGRPIACLAWSSAPRHLGSRDRYIGWQRGSAAAQHPLHRLQHALSDPALGPGAASGVTHSGEGDQGLSDDWERMYGHPVYFAETFIDPGRFRGTCYRAANWQLLGLTTGRGKNDQTNKPNRPIKEILGLPLTPRFRQLLSQL